MATIIWKEPKPQGTAKSRYKARRAERQAEHQEDARLARRIEAAGAGCSVKVARAVNGACERRAVRQSGSACLPEVALYAAGYRTVRKDATHIIK
ncbi:hypothetical protein [Erwinia sp. 9145]|uniref:transcriptional antitermination N peptide n=1 Tax=Erwinia sp. 9145 TaxID=1500895 RepID=UPI000550189E|nr:hypothetical protein [Erwinia sp. 9145]